MSANGSIFAFILQNGKPIVKKHSTFSTYYYGSYFCPPTNALGISFMQEVVVEAGTHLF